MGVLTVTLGGLSLGLLVGAIIGALRDRRRRRDAEFGEHGAP